ncbi:MAG: tRNA (adenosine(37)-N6)-threonylcarbamoyltransferase complex dimerization subunit type 1 TsaB [Oscillospiraceae bacterium]|nr:tRNA (adenosine(37)-N6)-threonylcarbamoyltransferase complex dimerization subunit type 1 TsaB [Oscillospiraceae bacterium]
MRILAFESSAKAASAAILEDGRLLGEYFQNSGQTHSRTLLQMAQDLLKNCGLAPRDVDALAVAAGPGSFTGVRIGAAAAKGFAWGLELPCFGVSTLEAMAWSAGLWEGLAVPAMDARRSQVYCAAFRMEAGVPARVMEDSAIAVEALGARLTELEGPKYLMGDGAALVRSALDLPDLRLLPEHLRHQRASGAALAAWRRYEAGARPGGGALALRYLRLSQAERERLERTEREENSQHG